MYSSRYSGDDGNDAANNAKLLTELNDVENRSARFRCVIVIAEAGEVLAHFDGAVEGTILRQLEGQGGFGYDPLFVPNGFKKTFAELGDEVKNGLSHRARAMEKVVNWLEQTSS